MVTPFTDNWAYLKTDLKWLERMLMAAVARRRQEEREIHQFSKSPADRVTSHWWKGLIVMEQKAAYDDRPSPVADPAVQKSGYQQQLEDRIQASQSGGIVLGVPLLRDRLNLNRFEKNLLLMVLAPEVNRRYGRLYRYLQSDQPSSDRDWPTVDLVLRLLCRNDQEWRRGRHQLAGASPLITDGLLHLLAPADESLLNHRLKLAPQWVSYLLAETPTLEEFHQLWTASIRDRALPGVQMETQAVLWTDVLVPESIKTTLQPLSHLVRVSQNSQADCSASEHFSMGCSMLLVGAPGTGKTLLARAIAHEAQVPLHWIDLAEISPQAFVLLLQHPVLQTVPLLLVKSAQIWFGRQAATHHLEASLLRAWWTGRQAHQRVTLLSTPLLQMIRPSWRQQMNGVVQLPMPAISERKLLWQRAFPSDLALDPTLDWERLARQVVLSGGAIQAIAQAATLQAIAESSAINLSHIRQALAQQGHRLKD